MLGYRQMTIEERVLNGKAWLDQHAPTGYVFNMFRFDLPEGKPRFVVDIYLNEYDVLALAFRHHRRIAATSGYKNIASFEVKNYFGMTDEESIRMGFDLGMKESSSQKLRELNETWVNMLELELYSMCNNAGQLLARVPKNESVFNLIFGCLKETGCLTWHKLTNLVLKRVGHVRL